MPTARDARQIFGDNLGALMAESVGEVLDALAAVERRTCDVDRLCSPRPRRDQRRAAALRSACQVAAEELREAAARGV